MGKGFETFGDEFPGVDVGYDFAVKKFFAHPENFTVIVVGEFQVGLPDPVMELHFVQDLFFYFRFESVLFTPQPQDRAPAGDHARFHGVGDAAAAQGIREPPRVADQEEVGSGKFLEDFRRHAAEDSSPDPSLGEFALYPVVEERDGLFRGGKRRDAQADVRRIRGFGKDPGVAAGRVLVPENKPGIGRIDLDVFQHVLGADLDLIELEPGVDPQPGADPGRDSVRANQVAEPVFFRCAVLDCLDRIPLDANGAAGHFQNRAARPGDFSQGRVENLAVNYPPDVRIL